MNIEVRTLRPDGKEGILIDKLLYEKISFVILDILFDKQDISIIELLDAANARVTENYLELPWLILQVKLDLEAQGFILRSNKARTSTIRVRLTRSGHSIVASRKRDLYTSLL